MPGQDESLSVLRKVLHFTTVGVAITALYGVDFLFPME
jgi:hypothetical protein